MSESKENSDAVSEYIVKFISDCPAIYDKNDPDKNNSGLKNKFYKQIADSIKLTFKGYQNMDGIIMI